MPSHGMYIVYSTFNYACKVWQQSAIGTHHGVGILSKTMLSTHIESELLDLQVYTGIITAELPRPVL